MNGRHPDQERDGLARRDFLRTAGLGAVAGVGAVALGGGNDAEADAPSDTAKGRYRETDHVRQVYDLSRF